MYWTPERIRALREKTNLDQEAFAKQLGFSHRSRVSELESGSKTNRTPSAPVQLLLFHIDAHGVLRASDLP